MDNNCSEHVASFKIRHFPIFLLADVRPCVPVKPTTVIVPSVAFSCGFSVHTGVNRITVLETPTYSSLLSSSVSRCPPSAKSILANTSGLVEWLQIVLIRRSSVICSNLLHSHPGSHFLPWRAPLVTANLDLSFFLLCSYGPMMQIAGWCRVCQPCQSTDWPTF